MPTIETDKFLAFALGSPAVMAVLAWILKASIMRNFKNIESQVERAVTSSMQMQSAMQDVLTRLAVYNERTEQQLGGLNRSVGGLEARQDKITERIDKLAEHWRHELFELSEKVAEIKSAK